VATSAAVRARPIFAMVLGGCLLASVPGLADEPVPTPAAPESLDDLPSAKREDVTRLLRKIRQRYGEDAVVIQTHLLLNAMNNGSVLATGVRVDKLEEQEGHRYLAFALETGMVFDDATRDETQRIRILWMNVLEPTLAHLKDEVRLRAEGIVVRAQYHHRPYRSADDLRASIDKPGTSEETSFYLSMADLDALVRKTVTLRELATRARVTVDGASRTLAMWQGEQAPPGPQ